MDSNLTVIAVALVTVFSSARLARLIVHDHWPPVAKFRDWWDRRTGASDWNVLFHCHFCVSVYTTAGVVLWGYFTDFDTVWWIVNSILAASYASAYVVTYDGADD